MRSSSAIQRQLIRVEFDLDRAYADIDNLIDEQHKLQEELERSLEFERKESLDHP